MNSVNILVTLDAHYLPQLDVMLSSLLHFNPDCAFDVYLLHTHIPPSALAGTRRVLDGRGRLIPIEVHDAALDAAPTTARYPSEIYYRIFAARYLPTELERILYLDPDIVINGSILPLYQLPMGEAYFAAASHIDDMRLLCALNKLRLDMDEHGVYINSGVMLMNLALLRREQNDEDVYQFIEKRRNRLLLPDQDIISGLYGDKIIELNTFRYNMTELLYHAHGRFDLDWVRKHCVVIHYCGRNKPWKENYIGTLDVFYHEAAARLET